MNSEQSIETFLKPTTPVKPLNPRKLPKKKRKIPLIKASFTISSNEIPRNP
ncbi:MAG: hypothetical protein ACTSSB_16705 [Candidatus Heimdallarchaeota archaeon]